MRTAAVIGGGASGMMAAITAAEAGARVILLEHKDRIGKKILSTGNGRCNFTNIHQEPICYHSEDPLFPWRVVSRFGARDRLFQEQERISVSELRPGVSCPGRPADGA